MTDNGRNYRELQRKRWQQGCRVCVGIDPQVAKIPMSVALIDGRFRPKSDVIYDFTCSIIDATNGVAGTYKFNSGFFEHWGPEGIETLVACREYLEKIAPEVPHILDAKRGDIGDSSKEYAEAGFETLGFDAMTLNPYLGHDGLEPFFQYTDKACFVLCLTSNPDAREFQDSLVFVTQSELEKLLSGPSRSCEGLELQLRQSFYWLSVGVLMPLFQKVALRAANYWNKDGNIGLVVAATYPNEAARIRRLVGDEMIFLVPGVGKQGGDLEKAVHASRNSRGTGFVLNVSSAISHASMESDFNEAAARAATEINARINEFATAPS